MPRIKFIAPMLMMALGLNACGKPADWLTYRHDAERDGDQLFESALSDPVKVLTSLHVGWQAPGPGWTASSPGPFRASPIVFNETVFIGDINGVFWAMNAADGSFRWRYPATGLGLNGSCALGGNGSWGQYGIQSSASFARIAGHDAVIFGAPDPDPATDGGNGSGRLWALDAATGSLIWKSDVIAHVNGCPGSLHERITYSSPLVFSNRVFVGVHDAGDDPVQKGKVVAVDLDTGSLASGFPFTAVGAAGDPTCGGVCGGGIWNSPATDGRNVIFTTGNVCDFNRWNTPNCQPEPSPDYSLSMVSINPTTGAYNWNFRAVPFKLDADPDWSAGVTSMHTSCGHAMASVQKDGWTYAVDPANGSCRWQFPPTAGASCVFSSTDKHRHSDDEYKQPGAWWGDYLFIEAGGEALTTSGVDAGYGRLHALDSCADDRHRVRWIADILPGQDFPYPLGAPVVTGGIVYVTTSTGHVIALADPAVAPPAGFRCSSVDIGPPSLTWPFDCVLAGYTIVRTPASRDVDLGDNGNAAGLRMEPAIAHGKLFVATDQGHVFALWP